MVGCVCLGPAVGFAVGFLMCAALGRALCWISRYIAPLENGEIARSFTLPSGVRPLRLVA